MQLLWRLRVPAAEPPAEFQAPSWSWASVNGEVLMAPSGLCTGFRSFKLSPDRGWTAVAHVLDVAVQLAGPDPMGPVLSGRLRMQGCLARVRRSCVTKKGSPPASPKIYDDNFTISLARLDHCTRDGNSGAVLTATLYLLPIVFGPASHLDAMYGIVLEPTGRQAGEFQHRGMFAYPLSPFDDIDMDSGIRRALPHPTLDRFAEVSLAPDAEHYEREEEADPVLGFRTYSFTII
jgi:hypothetical protein